MRFIQTMSYKSANYIMKQKAEGHDKRRVYYFGFQVIIGAIVKGVLLLSVAAITGTIVPTIVAMLVFAFLRILAGGYHMDTYGKCITTSVIMFVLSGIIAQYTYIYYSTYSIMAFSSILFVISLICIFKWAPVDNPNRPITKAEEINKFRNLSIAYMFLWILAVMVLLQFNLRIIAIASCFGLGWEILSITPKGEKFYSKISNAIHL